MNRRQLHFTSLLTVLALTGVSYSLPENAGTEGRLDALEPRGNSLGPCPLKHTDVEVEITGFVARVNVTQQFYNPFEHKIEATYAFPLSQDAAVDAMTMKVGARFIAGQIKERVEAQHIYETARQAGHVASMLDQERPNIFTQTVANIEPGKQVEITISYVEALDWKQGQYHFDFPMVVGPRYIPGHGSAAAPMEQATPTAQVPGADRITPPVVPEGMRSGHDITIAVKLDAGAPIQTIKSIEHNINIDYEQADKSKTTINLEDSAEIPNRDFVLTYRTSTDQIEDQLLSHTDERGNFFTLVLQPPREVTPAMIRPKEIIFVIDKSGSMRGFPIDTAKHSMRLCIKNLNPHDTFNLLTFEGGIGYCFDKPAGNTKENRARALGYLKSLEGSGGTEMMKAINAALGGPRDPERLRVVCFMTDGYVGNDMAIIDAVRTNVDSTRVFSFGIGKSVNRYLLDGMANAGRGEVAYVLNAARAEATAGKFYQRVHAPVLTDVTIDWGQLPVEEIYPQRIPDLFSATPVVVHGRYRVGGRDTITLRGNTVNGPFERKIEIYLPEHEPAGNAMASLWARSKVKDLMLRDLAGIQQGQADAAIRRKILGLGLVYGLVTQFTSFVAVEELHITEGGQPRTIMVPVEMPEGVTYEGVFGRTSAQAAVPMMTMRSTALHAGLRRTQATLRENIAMNGAMSRADMALEEVEAGGLTDDSKRGPLLKLKLAKELNDLVAQLKADPDSELSTGKIKVSKVRVEIKVHLQELSNSAFLKLKALGFVELARATSVPLLVGTIEVRKLEELALLKSVRWVEHSQALL